MLKIRLLINNFFYPLLALYVFCAILSLVGVVNSLDGRYGYIEFGQKGYIAQDQKQIIIADNAVDILENTKEVAPALIPAPPAYFWFTAGWVIFFSNFYFALACKTKKQWKKYWKKQSKAH